MSERRENSVLFSLKELRNIEDGRQKKEKDEAEARLEADRATKLAAERAVRDEEERKVREEQDRLRRIEDDKESRSREEQMRLQEAERRARVEGEVRLQEERLRLEVHAEGPDLALAVRDSGSGISPEERRRIFEPFYTTKPRGKGTGLGLAICREIARALKGRIDVESQQGHGSTFVLWIPYQPGSESQAAKGWALPQAVGEVS